MHTFIGLSKSALAAAAVACVSALAASNTAAQQVTVVEYYNHPLDAYFMTGRAAEQVQLDALPALFSRTGMRFAASAAATADPTQVRICRFYVNLADPLVSSHFYGRENMECEAIAGQNPSGFSFEGYDFAVAQPDSNGACAAATPTRVFRSFRALTVPPNGRTPNHRYTVSQARYEALGNAGWTAEQAVFCVATAQDATQATMSSFSKSVSLAQTPFAAGCGVASTGTLYSGAEVEPHLATNPSNPDHMVAAWQQDRWSNGSAQGLAGAVTFDGGRTWQNTLAAFSRCAGGNAANAGDYERATDPWVSIGADGTAFQMALTTIGSAFTNGAVSAMLVSRSVDGGRNWAPAQTLVRDVSATVFHDKNMLIADPVRPGYVYAVWGRLDMNGSGPAWFTRSTDGGLSWEPSRSIHDPQTSNQTFGNQLVVLPDGTLVNVFLEIIRTPNAEYVDGQRLRIIRSADQGASWSAPITIAAYSGIGTVDPETLVAVRDGVGIAQIAAGPDGRLHVVWQDARFNTTHDGIAYAQSSDGGLTWSEPVRVNANGNVPAFTPNVHVRRDGAIGVSYYDFRENTKDAQNLLTVYRLARSSDGVLWSESGIENAFDLGNAPVARGLFLGDYQGLSSNGSAFSALYARTTANRASNRTEIMFTHIADGTLKRTRSAYRALAMAAEFVVPAALEMQSRANLERVIAARMGERLR